MSAGRAGFRRVSIPDRSRIDLALQHLGSACLLARSIEIERVAVDATDLEVLCAYVRDQLEMFDDIEARNLSVRRVSGGLPPSIGDLRWAVELFEGMARAETLREAYANIGSAVVVAEALRKGDGGSST